MSSLGQVIKDALNRNEEYMLAAVEGLSSEELHQRPAPESNPIGWLMWHLSRVQDFAVSSMSDRETVWVRDGWYERFGMALDPSYRGNGDPTSRWTRSPRLRQRRCWTTTGQCAPTPTPSSTP